MLWVGFYGCLLVAERKNNIAMAKHLVELGSLWLIEAG